MDGDHQKSGPAHVREHFIDPLVTMGMVKKRSMTGEDYAKMLMRLEDKLSYMSTQNLRGLQELIVRYAGGKQHNLWPDEIMIRRMAFNLQLPPPHKSDYAQSLIRSAMGIRARDGGWLVELFQVAKRMGPPPNRYIISKLKDAADDNRRRRARIAEFIEVGRATPDELRWLDDYHRDMAECVAIMNAKEQEAAA